MKLTQTALAAKYMLNTFKQPFPYAAILAGTYGKLKFVTKL